MPTHQLDEAVLDGGIRRVNFFNGRLLSGEDMTTEQEAQREARALLGQAIGDGIVRGLEVRPFVPTGGATAAVTVTVAKGLAINGEGTALSLAEDAQVALVRTPDDAVAEAGFSACNCPGDVALTGSGLYVLTICPAEGFQSRAPTSGLGGSTCREGVPCGAKYAVSGVRFALVRIDVAHLPGVPAALRSDLLTLLASSTATGINQLRNRMAHLFLDTSARAAAAIDPLAIAAVDLHRGRSALAELRELLGLAACAVPLAVIRWTATGIRFIDLAAVRRRALAAPPTPLWPLAHAGGDPVIAEAAALQFQEHLDQLGDMGISPAQQAGVAATALFRHLPSLAVVPLMRPNLRGFQIDPFLAGLVRRSPPVHIEGARVAALMREALWHPPIDLSSGEAVWIYLVREQRQAIDAGIAVRPYLLVANGQITFHGEARFDLSRWDYANYL